MEDSAVKTATAAAGLSAKEAIRRLAQYGPNEVKEENPHPLRVLLGKFWSPVPWMLESTVILQLALGKKDEAAVIAVLLVFNAAMGFLQEGRVGPEAGRNDARYSLFPCR
ncbi:MAG: cation-transporting P-type ATPase [Syntrophales bacterium]